MKRKFSEGEDRILREQAAGKLHISVHRLEIDMKCSRETLYRRAADLGIELRRDKRSFFDSENGKEPLPSSDCAYRIRDDLLLKRLLQHHSDRGGNYGSTKATSNN